MTTTPSKQDKDSEIIAKRVASWRKEIARLQDLIQAAEPGAQDEMRAAFEVFTRSSACRIPAGTALDSEQFRIGQEAFKAGAQWQASRAPVVQAVQDGWQLVPIRPTDTMTAAGRDARLALATHMDSLVQWRAMLAAAPSAPQAVAAQDRDAVLEEAAQTCERFACMMEDGAGELKPGGRFHQAARSIRALKQAPQPIVRDGDVLECPTCGHSEIVTCCDSLGPQPIAAPVFDQAEFDEMVRKGTAAWENEPAPRDEPIAAPAEIDSNCASCGGAYRHKHNCKYVLHIESQQQVPALSASIDTPEFWSRVIAYCNGTGTEGVDLVAHVDAWAAQLVAAETQRCSEIAQASERIFADQLEAMQVALDAEAELRMKYKAMAMESAQLVQQRATLSDAARDVIAERQRQISIEGWTSKHDDQHDCHEMAEAAACYAYPELITVVGMRAWPWNPEWWKPKDRRSNLIRAGALLLAEIERLDRAILAATGAA